MSDKQSYDEDEIINSLVNEKTPNLTEEYQRNQQQNQKFNGRTFTYQASDGCGCGCFDPRKFVANFIIYAIVLMVTAGFFPGVYLDGVGAAIEASLWLTLLNTFVKPLILIFTFPLTIATLGLFYFIINAIIITMTASMMSERFYITNFWVAIIAALFISIMQYLIKKFILKTNQQL